MRILFLTNLFPPHVLGGYEIACRDAAVSLRERGHEVEVLASHAPVDTRSDPPWLHRQFALRAFSPIQPHTGELRDEHNFGSGCSQYANTAAVLQNIRSFQPDLVCVWNLYGVGGLAMLDLLEQLRIPWVFHLGDNVPNFLVHGIPRMVAELFLRRDLSVFSAVTATAISQHVVEEIEDTLGIRFECPPTIIPGWVDTRQLGQRQTYMPDGRLRMISIGSLGKHKGTDIVIDACQDLVSGGLSEFEVDVFGFGTTGPWVSRAASQGVSGHINFRGPRTHAEIMALLPNYDVLLFPTWPREAYGAVSIEAAACGVVPIMTRNAGSAERLVDGVHALKIDRSSASLAAAIARVLRGEVDIARLGRYAARLARSDLERERCIDRFEEVFEKSTRNWDRSVLDVPRLSALLFAKHALGQHLMAHP